MPLAKDVLLLVVLVLQCVSGFPEKSHNLDALIEIGPGNTIPYNIIESILRDQNVPNYNNEVENHLRSSRRKRSIETPDDEVSSTMTTTTTVLTTNSLPDLTTQENFLNSTNNIVNLTELSLRNKSIRSLSEIFGNSSEASSSEVEGLDLSQNHIVGGSCCCNGLKNVKRLNLSRNHLSGIYKDTFSGLFNLNTLILSHNNISDIDYDGFVRLSNLEYLDLSFNHLDRNSTRSLQNIPDLVGLSIAYNERLGESLQEFITSWSLQQFDASGTGLCKIPAALAQSVKALQLRDNWLQVSWFCYFFSFFFSSFLLRK